MSFLLKLFCLSFVLFLIPKTSKAEFVKLREDQIQPCKIKLSQAKKIPHQCQIITDKSSPLAVWQNRLDFNFGQISPADFDYLKKTYSQWSNSETAVVYSPNQSYQLSDFLPPLIQALNGHRFIPEATKFNQEDIALYQLLLSQDKQSSSCEQISCYPKKSLYMNCWGVVYEILRLAQNAHAKPTIFMAQSSIMLNHLRDNSRQLMTWQKPADFLIANQFTRTGDIILISHQSQAGYEYLDHIAIAIDEGIYFEKAGIGEDVPIRIIDEATLQQTWHPEVFRYELRRLNDNAILPHPQEIFTLNSPKIKTEIFPSTEKLSDNAQQTTVSWEIESQTLSSTAWFHLVEIYPLHKDDHSKAQLNQQLYQPILDLSLTHKF